jgi:GMP synthase-like glutamine amidotransferase
MTGQQVKNMTAVAESFVTATDERAKLFIEQVARRIGVGFHPDTHAADYVDANGQYLFDEATAAALNEAMKRAFAILGERIYEVAHDAIK